MRAHFQSVSPLLSLVPVELVRYKKERMKKTFHLIAGLVIFGLGIAMI